MFQSSDDLMDVMRQSFEFWHKNYVDSPLNYALVWKKGLQSNSEILKKIEKTWRNTMKQGAQIQIEQFLELWSYAIRKPSFDSTKKTNTTMAGVLGKYH